MKMRNTVLALVLCIPVAGYAASLAVNYDYDKAADFAALKTFDWMPATGNAAGDELLVKKIRNTVDAQLQAKGRKIAADKEALEVANKATASLYFANPLKDAPRALDGLFDTHPPIAERIRRLEAM